MGKRRGCWRLSSNQSKTRLVIGPVEDIPLWGTSASCAAANRRRVGLPTRRRLPACPTLSVPFEAVTELVRKETGYEQEKRKPRYPIKKFSCRAMRDIHTQGRWPAPGSPGRLTHR